MKKQQLFVCLMAALLSTAPSCQSVKEDTDLQTQTQNSLSADITAETETETAAANYFALPEADLGGFTFRMLHDVKGWGTYQFQKGCFRVSESNGVYYENVF